MVFIVFCLIVIILYQSNKIYGLKSRNDTLNICNNTLHEISIIIEKRRKKIIDEIDEKGKI